MSLVCSNFGGVWRPPAAALTAMHRPLHPNQRFTWVHPTNIYPRHPPQSSLSSSLQYNNKNAESSTTPNPELLTVTNLRELYSNLLTDVAPIQQHTTDSNSRSNNDGYKWKTGVVEITGTDDEGYDYSYQPSAARGGTTLSHGPVRGEVGGLNKLASLLLAPKRNAMGSSSNNKQKNNSKNNSSNGGGGGGEDNGSCDGIRRYHTGGAVVTTTNTTTPTANTSPTSSNTIMRVGGIDVDVGMLDGVELRQLSLNDDDDYGSGDEVNVDVVHLDKKFSIDDNDEDEDGMHDFSEVPIIVHTTNHHHHHRSKSSYDTEQSQQSDKPSSITTISKSLDTSTSPMTFGIEVTCPSGTNIHPHWQQQQQQQHPFFIGGGLDSNYINNNGNSMTSFESMYHLSPTTVWRLRSAYTPSTTHESHLDNLGSEILAHRHPRQAEAMLRGLDVARQSEVRVCTYLHSIGVSMSAVERLRGLRWKEKQKGGRGEDNDDIDDDDDDDDLLEEADATFAYFCEKNILPMLVDSFLCRPPPLTSDLSTDEFGSSLSTSLSLSPFSGITWTTSVKSQILQTIGLILINTTHTLSLTYLLSNNYMNELIMGMLPINRGEQWKDEALEAILPPYVTILRGLVMRLRGGEGESCLPLFLCRRRRRQRSRQSKRHDDDDDVVDDDDGEDAATETYIPLLFAAVHVFCLPQSTKLRDGEGSLLRTTAMNVILNLARLTDSEVRSVIVQGGVVENERHITSSSLPMTKSAAPSMASFPPMTSHPLTIEQELLFPHICNSLNSWYHRSVRLVMASLSIKDKRDVHEEAKAEARARHGDIAEIQFREIQYWLGFLDDLFSCGIDVWSARLVEWLLRDCIVGTVLLRLNRSLEVVVGKKKHNRTSSSNDHTRMVVSPETYKARAEIRVSFVFLTQLFGMVEYKPLVRLVGAAVLYPKYPHRWCAARDTDISKDNGFFSVTLAINALIGEKVISGKGGEEADAGAGGDEVRECQQPMENSSGHSIDRLIPNRHRAALLDMLAGHVNYSSDETILASMLLSAVLENDAIDDLALEVFGILPSPTENNEGDSPFETSIATYLANDWNMVDSNLKSLMSTVECVSTLGFMLLERLVFHTWTEAGQCMEVVPFDHCFKSSVFIRGLTSSLRYFSSQALNHLQDASAIRDIVSSLVRRRYLSSTDINVSPVATNMYDHGNLVCSLQSYYPSNYIDNSSVLASDILRDGSHSDSDSGDLVLFNQDNEAALFSIQASIHLRSLLGSIHEFYQRFTSSKGSRLYNRRQFLSFNTKDEAGDVLFSIGGFRLTTLPEVGTNIDFQGRKYYHCSLPRKGRNTKERFMDVNGSNIVVTEQLVLVLDTLEMYITKPRRDNSSQCTVLKVVPLRTIIASATEGALLHTVCHEEHLSASNDDIIENGRLSLRFVNDEACLLAKESIDQHCTEYEKKTITEMKDMLEKYLLVGAGNYLSNSSQTTEIDDSWCDFQQA